MSIKENLIKINNNIEEYIAEYNSKIDKREEKLRKPEIIIVTKYTTIEQIKEVLELKEYYNFGENKLQDAEEKWPALLEEYPNIKLHFIGNMQTNKVEGIVKLFNVIHSITSTKLASRIIKAEKKLDKIVKKYIQINISREISKGGVTIEEYGDIYKEISGICRIKGLMTIASKEGSSESNFEHLAKIAKELSLEELSIGMSG